MVQKLSLLSVLTLVVLAAVGSVVVATHAFSAAGPSLPAGAQVLSAPPASASSGQGGSGPDSNQTVTTTVTQSLASSNATAVQTSTSGSSGSLLVSGNPASGSNSTSDDGGDDGGFHGLDD